MANCPVCNFKNRSSAKFCSNCGNSLKGQKKYEDIYENLKQLIDTGGYLIVSVKEYYVQFATEENGDELLFESVSGYYVPSVRAFDSAFVQMGFSSEHGGNYRKVIALKGEKEDTVIEKIISETEQIFKIYQVKFVNYKIECSFNSDEAAASVNALASSSAGKSLSSTNNSKNRIAIRWLIAAGILGFVFAIYKSEKGRLAKLPRSAEAPASADTSSVGRLSPSSTVPHIRDKKRKDYFVSEFSGDTIDTSQEKFIMILADRFSDKKISYSVTIWSGMETCAWSPGILMVSVYDTKNKLLKKVRSKIDKELPGQCQQLEELDLYMGDLIKSAAYLSAEFTDESGATYKQSRVNLGEIIGATPEIQEDDRAALQLMKEEISALLEALLAFKDRADFHRYGFGVGYKYHTWLQRVKELKQREDRSLLLIYCGFGVGDLELLGLEYMGSQGRETEFTVFTKDKIKRGLEEK